MITAARAHLQSMSAPRPAPKYGTPRASPPPLLSFTTLLPPPAPLRLDPPPLPPRSHPQPPLLRLPIGLPSCPTPAPLSPPRPSPGNGRVA